MSNNTGMSALEELVNASKGTTVTQTGTVASSKSPSGMSALEELVNASKGAGVNREQEIYDSWATKHELREENNRKRREADIRAAVEQSWQDRKAQLQKELDEIKLNAGWITTTEQYDQQEKRRNEIIAEMSALDKKLSGNAEQEGRTRHSEAYDRAALARRNGDADEYIRATSELFGLDIGPEQEGRSRPGGTRELPRYRLEKPELTGNELYQQRKSEQKQANRDFWSSLLGLVGTGSAMSRGVPNDQQLQLAREQQRYAMRSRDAANASREAAQAIEWEGRQELVDEYKALQSKVAMLEGSLDRSMAANGDPAKQAALEQAQDRLQEVRALLEAGDKEAGNGPRDYSARDKFDSTVGGTGKKIGGQLANAAITTADLMAKGYTQGYSNDQFLLDQALGVDSAAQRKMIQEGYNSAESRDMWNKMYAVADRISDSAAADLEKAKNGLGAVGQAGIDVAENVMEMAFDAGVAAATGGSSLVPMFARVFGQGAQEARQAGASLEQQVLYGTATGAIEVLTEKLADGVAGIYGKGAADDITEALVRRLSSSQTGQNILRTLLGASSEGVEEVLSDLLNPLAQAIYKDESIKELYGQLDPAEMLYDYLIGGFIGLAGGAANVASGGGAQANATNDYLSQTYEALGESPSLRQEIRDRGILAKDSAGAYENMSTGQQVNEAMQGLQGKTPESVRAEQLRTLDRQAEAEYRRMLDVLSRAKAEIAANNYNEAAASATSYTKAAADLLNDEELLAEYVRRHGEPQGNSQTERLRSIAETLRADALAYAREQEAKQQAEQQTAQQEQPAAEEQSQPETDFQEEPITAAQEITEARADNNAENNHAADTVVDILANPRPSKIKQALSPEFRAAYKALTGQELPESKRKAVDAIMEQAKKPDPIPNVGRGIDALMETAGLAPARQAAQTAQEAAGEPQIGEGTQTQPVAQKQRSEAPDVLNTAEREARAVEAPTVKATAQTPVVNTAFPVEQSQPETEKSKAHTEQNSRDVAKEIKKSTETSLDVKTIQSKIQEIADYVASNNNGNGMDYDELRNMAENAAFEILYEKYITEGGDKDIYERLRQHIDTTPILISDELRGDQVDYAKDWIKRNGLKLNLRKEGGLPIDSFYSDLPDKFGEGLFPRSITAHADMLNRISDTLDKYRPKEKRWVDTVDNDEYIAEFSDVVQKIMDAVMNEGVSSEATDPRFADSGYMESLGDEAPPLTVTLPDTSTQSSYANPDNTEGEQKKQKPSRFWMNALDPAGERGSIPEQMRRPLWYLPKSEKQSLFEATQRLNANKQAEIEKLIQSEAWSGVQYDMAQSIAEEMYRQSRETGNNEAYLAWVEIMSQHTRESARAVQAGAKYTRATPERIVAEAAEKLNESNLSEEEKSQTLNAVADFADEYGKILYGGEPEKAEAKQTTAPESAEPSVDITDAVRGPEASAGRAANNMTPINGTQATGEITDAARGPEEVPGREANPDMTPINGEQVENEFTRETRQYTQKEIEGLRELIMQLNDYRGTGTIFKKNFKRFLDSIDDGAYLDRFAQKQMAAISDDATYKLTGDVGSKVKTIQVLNQLFSLATTERNLAGNFTFSGLDLISQDLVGYALDKVISKFTGKKTVGFNKGIFSDRVNKAGHDAMIRSLLEIAADVDMQSKGKYGTNTSRSFKMSGDPLSCFYSRWEQILGYMLTSPDQLSKGRIAGGETEALEKLKNSNLTQEDIAEISQQTADYRTFQNKGAAAKASNLAHDALNTLAGFGGDKKSGVRKGGFGLGDLVLPYATVPANLGVKLLEHSPANVAKGLATLVYNASTGKLTAAKQNQSVMDMARGLTGTALIAAFAAIAKAGQIKDWDDEDDYEVMAQNKAEGKQGLQWNLSATMRGDNEWRNGDTLVNIGFLEPIDQSMRAGVMLAEEAPDGIAEAGIDLLTASARSIADLPAMESISSIEDMISNVTKAEDDNKHGIKNAILQTLGDSASGFVPAPFRHAATLTDPYMRETSSTDKGNAALNRIMNSIPGLRKQLDVKTDAYGREVLNGSAGTRAANLLLPGRVDKLNQSEVSSAIDALVDASGKKSLIPARLGPKTVTVNKEKINLTDEQRESFGQARGEAIFDAVDALITAGTWDKMDDEAKLKAAEDIKEFANDEAKRQLAEESGQPYSSDWDDERSQQNPAEYIATRAAFTTAKNEQNYSAIDALLQTSGIYGSAKKWTKDALADNQTTRDLAKLEDAKKAGIKSEAWYTVKAEHDRISKLEGLTSTEKANKFKAYLMSKGYSDEQIELLTGQHKYTSTNTAETKKFDDMTGAGLAADKAEKIYSAVSDLGQNAKAAQIYRAIYAADYLTEEEKRIAFNAYATDAAKKEAQKYSTFAEFIANSKKAQIS